MTLDDVNITFQDTRVNFNIGFQPAPLDNDYLTVAVFYGTNQITLFSTSLHALVGSLPVLFS